MATHHAKAAKRRWAKTTKKERQAIARHLVELRQEKRARERQELEELRKLAGR